MGVFVGGAATTYQSAHRRPFQTEKNLKHCHIPTIGSVERLTDQNVSPTKSTWIENVEEEKNMDFLANKKHPIAATLNYKMQNLWLSYEGI